MSTEENFRGYHEYLKRRRWRGRLYVKGILYPKLCRLTKRKVLDVGCGTGDFLECCKGAAGIDINPYNVAYCRERGLNALLMKGTKFPFENGTFDSVVIDNVLEHIEAPEGLMGEIRRVLTDGGLLVAGVPGRRGFEHDSDHKRFYDEASLDALITAHGFRCSKKFYMPLFRSAWLDRRLRQYCLYGIYIAGQ